MVKKNSKSQLIEKYLNAYRIDERKSTSFAQTLSSKGYVKKSNLKILDKKTFKLSYKPKKKIKEGKIKKRNE